MNVFFVKSSQNLQDSPTLLTDTVIFIPMFVKALKRGCDFSSSYSVLPLTQLSLQEYLGKYVELLHSIFLSMQKVIP